jgi:hypothetical protein
MIDFMEAVESGLDFFVDNQISNNCDANRGRYPFVHDCVENKTLSLTTNWTTGVVLEAMLAGYKHTNKEKYLRSAELAAEYIKSLQRFTPFSPDRNQGVFRETSPQTEWAHPRDALTAAWALLDLFTVNGDEECKLRSISFADWFIEVAMDSCYPRWTVRFDKSPWDPEWFGSFHSGGAFFFHRLYTLFGDERHLKAMRTILDFYNKRHLDANGNITVILDRSTLEPLDGKANHEFTTPGWEMMHRYNDDFGALANLAAFKNTGGVEYRCAAVTFLSTMLMAQNDDGGFGPENQSVPSAGGSVLIEMLAAKRLGLELPDEIDQAIVRASEYILNLRYGKGESANAFLGFDEDYKLSDRFTNARTGAYAILALLRMADRDDEFYFLF